MIVLLVLLLASVGVMRILPDIALSRLMAEWLARRPAAWLLRRTRREILAWSIATGLLLFGGEFVLVLGGPHAVLAFAADLAVYIDALIAVTTLASVAWVRAGASWLGRKADRIARPRSKRRARRTAVRKASNDDEERPAFAVAA